MVTYFLRRIALTIPTFLALMFLTFAAIRLVPGDPVEVRAGEHGMAPELLLAHSIVFEAMRSNVTGYKQSPLGTHAFEGVDIQ